MSTATELMTKHINWATRSSVTLQLLKDTFKRWKIRSNFDNLFHPAILEGVRQFTANSLVLYESMFLPERYVGIRWWMLNARFCQETIYYTQTV